MSHRVEMGTTASAILNLQRQPQQQQRPKISRDELLSIGTSLTITEPGAAADDHILNLASLLSGLLNPREAKDTQITISSKLLGSSAFLQTLMFYVSEGHLLMIVPLRLFGCCLYQLSEAVTDDTTFMDFAVQDAIQKSIRFAIEFESGELLFSTISLLRSKDPLSLNVVMGVITVLCMLKEQRTAMSLLLASEPSIVTIISRMKNAPNPTVSVACVHSMLMCLLSTKEGARSLQRQAGIVDGLVRGVAELEQQWKLMCKI